MGARGRCVAVQRERDFFVTQTLKPALHQRGSLLGRKPINGLGHTAQPLAMVEIVDGSGNVRQSGERNFTARYAPAMLQGIQCRVGRNPIEPGPCVGVEYLGIEGPIGSDQYVLAYIFGVVKVADQPDQVSENLPSVLLNQLIERYGRPGHNLFSSYITTPRANVKFGGRLVPLFSVVSVGCAAASVAHTKRSRSLNSCDLAEGVSQASVEAAVDGVMIVVHPDPLGRRQGTFRDPNTGPAR